MGLESLDGAMGENMLGMNKILIEENGKTGNNRE